MSELDLAEEIEWAQSLWFKNETLTHFFRYAAWLERNGYFINDSARNSDFDNWTNHVSFCLAANDSDVDVFVTQAPLRSVLFASVFRRNLDEEANDARKKVLENCSNIMLGRGTLKAQEELLTVLGNSAAADDADAYDFAFKLLLLFGTEAQLATLPVISVDLANEPFSSADIGKLGAIKNLEELDLRQTQISREGTGFLANLNNLRKLNLSDTRLMSSSLAPLRTLTKLEELSLAGTQVNETCLPSLAHLTGLKTLDVRKTALVGSIETIRKLLPECRVIVQDVAGVEAQ